MYYVERLRAWRVMRVFLDHFRRAVCAMRYRPALGPR